MNALLAKFGMKLGGPLVIAALAFLAASLVGLSAALVYRAGLANIDAMTANAASAATKACNAEWKAEIAQSNQKAAEVRADQIEQSLRIQALAASQVHDNETKLQQLEAENAALKDDRSCGLSRDRVLLLNKQ